MINEIYKLYKRNFFLIVFIIIIIVVFVLSLFVNNMINSGNEYNLNKINYKNFDEVKDIILDIEESLVDINEKYSNGDINSKDYNEAYKNLSSGKIIYQYLFDNKINSDDFEMISTLPLSSNIGFNIILISALRFLLSIVFIILPIMVIDIDFLEGTVCFVYSVYKPRTKIILYKLITIFITSTILILFSILMSLLFSSVYTNNFKFIIDYCDGEVFQWTNFSFTIYMLLSLFIDTIPYLILATVLSLLSSDSIKNLIIGISVYSVIVIAQMFINSNIVNLFTTSCFLAMNVGISLYKYFICVCFKYCISIVLLLLSLRYFSIRKNLL